MWSNGLILHLKTVWQFYELYNSFAHIQKVSVCGWYEPRITTLDSGSKSVYKLTCTVATSTYEVRF